MVPSREGQAIVPQTSARHHTPILGANDWCICYSGESIIDFLHREPDTDLTIILAIPSWFAVLLVSVTDPLTPPLMT